MAVERLIGVDFGTSTSVIRVKRYENGKPAGEMLETKEVIFGGNGAMVPTLVMKKDDDASVCYFGYEAQQKKKRVDSGEMVKDPVCGTYVEKDSAITVRNGEQTLHFCSYECRQKYIDSVTEQKKLD